MLGLNNICIHGAVEWNDPKSEKVSSEYFEGAYPVVRCNIQGTTCAFKNNYKDCELWEKKDQEQLMEQASPD